MCYLRYIRPSWSVEGVLIVALLSIGKIDTIEQNIIIEMFK